MNIEKNGYTIVRNGIDIELVNKVVSDFKVWCSNPDNNVKSTKDKIINFHIYNDNTLDLVTNKHTNKILTSLFNEEQVVYSSIFLREGTQQQYTRNTPHFYTNPIDKYYGVFYALEDIDIKSGPLKYYIGSHKLNTVDGHEIFNSLYNETDDVNLNNDYRCFIKYDEKLINNCKELNLIEMNEKNYKKLYKGDIFIWHPKLVHGGSNILDTSLTQYGMITHNIPKNTAVFDASHYFSKMPTEKYLKNECVFDYINYKNINIVDHKIGPIVQTIFVNE